MEQLEIWKTIPNFEYYQVSNLGRVKSLKFGKERILKAGIDHGGYSLVILSLNGKTKSITLHKLVAMAFLNHNPCGMKLVINHINFNRLDNSLSNLEIISQRENCNKKHLKSSSKYTGVFWNKLRNKWITRIQINGKNKHLGYFTNEEDASEAYTSFLKTINN